MAKIEDSIKRRSSDMDEQSVTPRAPPKKRFLSRASSPSQSGDTEDNEDSTDTFKEPLEAFRKDAIMRQWKEYRRSVQRWKTYIDDMESSKQQSEDHLQSWEDYFKKLQTFLLNIIQDDMVGFGQLTTPQGKNPILQHFIDDEWHELTPILSTALKKKDLDGITVIKLNQLMDAWVNKRESVTAAFSSIFDNHGLSDIKREHDRIISSWKNNQHALHDLRNNYKEANFKVSLELNHLEIRSSHSEDVVMADIPIATKTIAETPTSIVYNSQGISQDPLIHAQQSLEQRLREIELIKEDRISIKQQIARLEMDLITLPESRIYKAPLCRQLFQSRSYQKDKSNHLSDICHDLQNNYDDMCNKRRRLIKDLDIEQVSHFKGLEDQLHKLDIDLTRIRGQRDALQMSLEEKKAATEVGRQSIIELKLIAETRKERVSFLETEMLRLQRKMAAKTGVKGYYDLFVNSDGREPLLTGIQNEVKSLQEKVEEKKSELYKDLSPEIVDKQLSILVENDKIQSNIHSFEAKYGFHPSLTDEHKVDSILQDRIQHENTVINDLMYKVTQLENTEKHLLSEIDSVAKAYNDLEEANINKVRELADTEDDILRLQSERVKYSQAFTALNKSKDAHAMVANALNKQIEKQLAHIKQLNEREKNLVNQTTCLDRELNTCNAVYDIYKQKNDEAKITLDELKEKTLFIKDKIAEVQKSILDQIRMIEEGAHTRLRLQESSELMRKKIEATTKVEKPAEMKLRKEREEYRVSFRNIHYNQ
ncbi:hypothetical protein BDB01DRAFT_725672 [Pilobolus umbonatus]|nr:hypothetical protein BDB01DRAFT_725672 [Pilobolus umbonatus]